MTSFLFVPSDRLDRVAKAVDSGADNVIIDLEDAVFGADKGEIYQSLTEFAQTWDWTRFERIWLRTVGVRHADFMNDVAMLDLPFFGVVLPKVQSPYDVAFLKSFANKPVIAVIENAKGVVSIPSIAKSGVWAMSYGCLDLAVSVGVTVGTPSAQVFFDRVRTDLLLHSVINDINPPIETIYPDFGDDDGLVAYIKRWQDLGFRGQLFIHPKQVKVYQTMSFDGDKLTLAQKIIAHHKETRQAVFAIDGQMVDLPVIQWAYDYVGRWGDDKGIKTL